MDKNFEEFLVRKERQTPQNQRFVCVEHDLQFLLSNCETDLEDWMLLDELKQAIIVFTTKDKFGENNDVFLTNMKKQFYRAIEELEKRNPGIQTFRIKLFMEDFYF